MTIRISVATHKRYWMPTYSIYMPLHVGREGKADLGYTGHNISTKNSSFCELTGLYWAWKNLKDVDYIGIAHYRRHFVKHGLHITTAQKQKAVIGGQELEELLQKHDVIVPSKRHYYIETTRSQYEHAHNPNDLVEVKNIIDQKHPQYAAAFETVMNQTSGHRFNMFIMSKQKMNDYCTWLFDILFELEQRIDPSKYNKYNSRIFGFMSERLFDVWLCANNIEVFEQSVSYMEHQNWATKILHFIKRKINGGVDYEK